MSKKKLVWIAEITQSGGNDLHTRYASETKAGVQKQVYEFVLDRWPNIESQLEKEGRSNTHVEAIKMYFEGNDEAWCEVYQVEVRNE